CRRRRQADHRHQTRCPLQDTRGDRIQRTGCQTEKGFGLLFRPADRQASLGQQGSARDRQLHRRAPAHDLDRAAARISDALAGRALRRNGGPRSGPGAKDRNERSAQPLTNTASDLPLPRISTAKMTKALSRVVALLVAVAGFALAPAAQAAGPNVAHFTLANGLELVVIPDHRAPVVTHMIWYKIGSADEQPGQSGIAHFLEHLMFKGTKKNPAGYFSQLVSDVGGRENAFTSDDYTAYFQRVPSDQLRKMMELEADRMTGLVLTDAVVLPERDVVLEEQNMRVANRPQSRLDEQLDAALYLNHPYGRPVIGWRAEIEKLNRDEAIAFYHRYYAPNNAIGVVAGDVDPEQVKALAETSYGKI